jgi:hypothetical protein
MGLRRGSAKLACSANRHLAPGEVEPGPWVSSATIATELVAVAFYESDGSSDLSQKTFLNLLSRH